MFSTLYIYSTAAWMRSALCQYTSFEWTMSCANSPFYLHRLRRYARFSSYVEYYSTCGLSSLTPDDLFSIPQLPAEISNFLLWSSHARIAYQTVPSLNRWCLSTLSGGNPPVPYLYLAGVNDIPTALATLVLCTQQNGAIGQGVDSLRHIITFWMDKIGLVGYEKSQLEQSDTSGESPRFR